MCGVGAGGWGGGRGVIRAAVGILVASFAGTTFFAPEPRLTIFMPREGVGVALVAQVGHLVTYCDPPEGTLLTPLLPKIGQKRVKRGYPLF